MSVTKFVLCYLCTLKDTFIIQRIYQYTISIHTCKDNYLDWFRNRTHMDMQTLKIYSFVLVFEAPNRT